MPKLLVFQHVAYEPLGTLDPHLRREGFRIRYVNFARHPHAEPAIDGYDALVVLGGYRTRPGTSCRFSPAINFMR